MYQGYDGVERPNVLSRGPGMVNPNYYNTAQYVPQTTSSVRSVPPHGGMGTGMMGPGMNYYQY